MRFASNNGYISYIHEHPRRRFPGSIGQQADSACSAAQRHLDQPIVFSSRSSARCGSPGPLIIASSPSHVCSDFTHHLPLRDVWVGLKRIPYRIAIRARGRTIVQEKDLLGAQRCFRMLKHPPCPSLANSHSERRERCIRSPTQVHVMSASLVLLSLHTCRHGAAQGQVQGSCGFSAALAKRSRCRRQLPVPGPYRA